MMRFWSIVRRIAQAVFVVWGVTLVAFVIARVLPGNPVYLVVGSYADPATVREAAERLGLDRSIAEQYWIYVRDLAHGDLGTSITTSNPVTTDLSQRIPATVELATATLVLIVALAFPLGTLAALRPRGLTSRLADIASAGGVAIPQFWLGLMLIYVFFYRLDWLPAPLGRLPEDVGASATGWVWLGSLFSGHFALFWDATRALLLPALTLAVTVMPPLVRVIQTSLQSALESDAVRTARALGLSPFQVIFHDAFRLALLPILEMCALIVGILISSAVLVETVFSWPGLGQYAVNAINSSDYSAVQAVVLVSAVTYVCVYLLVSVAQVLIDPRVVGATR
jgi:peptide/nickel transport system permease protein